MINNRDGNPIVEIKKQIRKEKLALRRSYHKDILKEYDEIILNKILQSKMYQNCKEILVYVSYNNEVNTISLIKQALEDKKQVFCPMVDGDFMDFFEIHGMQDLSPGCMGILEPKKDEKLCFRRDIFQNTDDVLMILPMVAFHPKGHRIGYGRAYYDRYLTQLTKPIVTMGIAYCFQEDLRIQPEETDVALQYIVTNQEIIVYDGE